MKKVYFDPNPNSENVVENSDNVFSPEEEFFQFDKFEKEGWKLIKFISHPNSDTFAVVAQRGQEIVFAFR
jgi:hypothetical protein